MNIVSETQNELIIKDRNIVSLIVGVLVFVFGLILYLKPAQFNIDSEI